MAGEGNGCVVGERQATLFRFSCLGVSPICEKCRPDKERLVAQRLLMSADPELLQRLTACEQGRDRGTSSTGVSAARGHRALRRIIAARARALTPRISLEQIG